jgi:glycosyl hydrolase family 1
MVPSEMRSVTLLAPRGAVDTPARQLACQGVLVKPASERVAPALLFRSFWLGGFESACHRNRHGARLDMVAATQHDVQVNEDYTRLASLGIQTVRDGISWPRVDHEGRLDLSSARPSVEAAARQGVQVIWTLCHYGWPDDVDPYSPEFVSRFARYCGAVARLVAEHTDEVPFYTPINEISFLAWASGEVGWFSPPTHHRGVELKRQLVRAVIAGSEAIWEVDPRARLVHVDPLIHVVPPRDRPDLAEAAARQRASQFEAWDQLAGLRDPELGGHPRYVDVMGLNFYHSNQWEFPNERLRWEDHPRDDRWVPLHQLLLQFHARYRRPLFLGETSHFGVGRAAWIREIADEVIELRAAGVPFEGICLYPILDRPDWDDPLHWHNSGLWDLHANDGGRLERVLNEDYARELRRGQTLVASSSLQLASR